MGQHHALGPAGGARGVDHGGQLFGLAVGAVGDGLGLRGDLLPGDAAVRRGQGQGDPGQLAGDARLHLGPVVQLADEHHPGIAVLQDHAHRVGGEGGIEGHGDVAGHPDAQVGEHPVGAVLADEGDVAVGRQAERAQVGRDAARLGHGLAPGVVDHLAVALRLGEEHPVGNGGLPVIGSGEQQLVGADVHGVIAPGEYPTGRPGERGRGSFQNTCR